MRWTRAWLDSGLYQHHFPSRRVSLPALMGLMADAVEAGRGGGLEKAQPVVARGDRGARSSDDGVADLRPKG
jgi:hypothetical protein